MNSMENGANDNNFIQNDTALKNPEEGMELAANIDELMGETEGRGDEQGDTKASDEQREAMGRQWEEPKENDKFIDIERRINTGAATLGGSIADDKCIRCNVNSSKC